MWNCTVAQTSEINSTFIQMLRKLNRNESSKVFLYHIVCKGEMRSQHYLKPPPDILNPWSNLKLEFFAPKGNCVDPFKLLNLFH